MFLYSPAPELSRVVITVSMSVCKVVSEDADCATATNDVGDLVLVYSMVVGTTLVSSRSP